MAMKKQKLTQRLVDTAKPQDRDYFIRDTQIPGFALKVARGGSLSWVYEYKHKPSGKNKRWKIGDASTMPAKDVREAAMELHNNIRKGVYPTRYQELGTAREICEKYISANAIGWKTTNADRNLRKFVIPEFGDEACNDITPPRVQSWITSRMANGEPVTNLQNSLTYVRSSWRHAYAHGYTKVASPLAVVSVQPDYSRTEKKPDSPKYVPSDMRTQRNQGASRSGLLQCPAAGFGSPEPRADSRGGEFCFESHGERTGLRALRPWSGSKRHRHHRLRVGTE
jgi:hypothetical protein